MEATTSKRTAFHKYPAYKDSGVEWLGEIPLSWNALSNKYIFKLRKTLVGKKSSEFVLLSLTLNGIVKRDMVNPQGKFPAEFDTYQEVKKGDFVFCLFDVEETPRCVGLSPYNGMITGAYTVMQTSSDFDARFLYYFYLNLDSDKRLKPLYTGLRNTISKDAFLSFKTIFPNKEEQTAIARFLDEKTAKIDKAIAQKERLIALLKERKQIIIQQAVTKGLNPNAKMKHSGVSSIGQIPKNWTVKKLKYLLKSQGRIGFKGYTTSDLVDEGEGALTLGASHMDWDGNLKLTDRVYISWKKYYESPEIMVSRGDIVIVQRGSTCGKVALIDCDLGPMTINPSLILLKKINDNSHFVLEAIKVVLGEILNLVSNTAIPMISQFQVDNIEIALPNRQEQDAIINYVHSKSNLFVASIQLQEKQIEKLKEYRSVLIDSAVTGKIKVN